MFPAAHSLPAIDYPFHFQGFWGGEFKLCLIRGSHRHGIVPGDALKTVFHVHFWVRHRAITRPRGVNAAMQMGLAPPYPYHKAIWMVFCNDRVELETRLKRDSRVNWYSFATRPQQLFLFPTQP